MNTLRKNLGFALGALLIVVSQSACNSDSNPPPAGGTTTSPPASSPASDGQPGTVSSPSPGFSWNNVSERIRCENEDLMDCRGGYGFTVFNDGTYRVGPAASGFYIYGSLTANEFNTLNQNAAAVAGDNLSGNLKCTVPQVSSSTQDTVSLTLPGSSVGVLVYQEYLTSEGSQCYRGTQQNSFQLHNEMNELLNKYYSVPFPRPRPTPTVTITPIPSPTLSPIQNGAWGGRNVQMNETDQRAYFRFGCSHAITEGPILVNSQGGFSALGTYFIDQGPIYEDDPRQYPAVFSGTVHGRVMNVTIRYTGPQGNRVSHQYRLIYGEFGEVGTICALSEPSSEPTPEPSSEPSPTPSEPGDD